MILSRAFRRSAALARQQRALSAAPQPVYEPHVARTRVVIKKLKPAGTGLLRDVEFHTGPPVEDRRERRPHGVLRRLHRPRHEPHVRAVPGGDALRGNQISGTPRRQ